MTDEPRKYPLRRPEGHVPPVPRWRLILPEDAPKVHIAYVGVQRHGDDTESRRAEKQAIDALDDWSKAHSPEATETFATLSGNDVQGSFVRVAYWLSGDSFAEALQALDLRRIHEGLGAGRENVGLWVERFGVGASRLETNYTGLDYLPGLGSLPRTETERHTLTAYWGAARDRIPDSAHDLFGSDNTTLQQGPVDGRGRHLRGTNARNAVHIRSGQWWADCPEDETESYERKLEPTLRAGMGYLLANPVDTGTLGLRYLRNTTTTTPSPTQNGGAVDGEEEEEKPPLKETCVAATFTSLGALEGWAKGHKSHLAIYNGAMRHAKTFGPERRFRTWHEVVVLGEGEGTYEYLNCGEGTGVMGRMELRDV